MKIKPILFNTDMVKAILEGRKRVTRRVIKPQPESSCVPIIAESFGKLELQCNGGVYAFPYQAGDILYVRETWAHLSDWIAVDPDVGIFDGYIYKADWDNNAKKAERPEWKPSIHMPKDAARIFLQVTNVSVAKLHDITEEDAYREGVMKAHDPTFNVDYWYYKSDQNYMNGICWTESARQCFLWGLWNGTLKSSKEYEAYNNNRNPWVWIIEFERTEKPEDF